MFFKNKKTIGFLAIIIVIVIGFAFQKYGDDSVFAAGNGNMNGYAWSENIGWINTNNTLTNNYKVSIAIPGGAFSGYAWGEGIGWIDFAPVGAPPASAYNSAISGKMDLSTGVVTGWARIESLKNEYGAGWISFKGQNYGLVFDTATWKVKGDLANINNPNRWAWSDDIGWIDFKGVTLQNLTTVTASSLTVTPTIKRSGASLIGINIIPTGDDYTISSTPGNSILIGDILNVGAIIKGTDDSDLTAFSTNNWACRYTKDATNPSWSPCDTNTGIINLTGVAGVAQIQFGKTGTYEITYNGINGVFDKSSVIMVRVPPLTELR